MGLNRINAITWTDGGGNEQEIKDLRSSHIVNIIALLERKRINLTSAAEMFPSKHISHEIRTLEKDIITFITELENREGAER